MVGNLIKINMGLILEIYNLFFMKRKNKKYINLLNWKLKIH